MRRAGLSASAELLVNISQHLAKLRARVGILFLTHEIDRVGKITEIAGYLGNGTRQAGTVIGSYSYC